MKLLKPISILFALLLISLIGFTACSTNSNSSGKLSISLTDAPANYEEVNINIESVRVHREEDAETDEDESDEEAQENGWITVLDEPITVNLLNLRNGNEISLGSVDVEAGEYSQIRFILGSENTVVVDGQTFDLKTPSGQTSGLKLNINADIEEGEDFQVLVDFDAARSIVETGNGMYLLKPVLRAVNVEEAGSIEGTVEPADFETFIFTITNGDTLSTSTDENGEFELSALSMGTYDLTLQPQDSLYRDSTITDIEVTSGEETELGTITLQQ